MKIQGRLTLGIGVLFAMILLLGIQSVSYVRQLSRATGTILADNYNSLQYAGDMLRSLNDIGQDSVSRHALRQSLALQQQNITEVSEKELTAALQQHVASLSDPVTEAEIQTVRADLYRIMEVNMAAIRAKSSQVEERADYVMWWLIVVAALCALVAGAVLVWFPRMVLRPIDELKKGIKEIASHNYGKRLDFTGNREFESVAESFNNMADSLQETERQRREFIANVSHELKTPMTTIAGYTDGILDGTIPPEQEKEYLRIISDEARRLSRLVRRMLEVSQLQSRDLTRTKAPFDVCESMRRVLISMEKKITDRGLDVDADIPDSGIMVLGDNDLITQVIYNLLENAAKFARKGSALYLGVTTLNGKALISVRNEGDTIPAEEIPLLFERFHKSDKSRSEDKDGVGLGLYVVKTILDQHKEHIAVTSENGLTTFTFSVTLAGGQTAQ